MELADIKTEIEKYHSLTEKGFQAINSDIEMLAKAMPRPGAGASNTPSEHRKAFDGWLRSGRNEDELADLQQKSMLAGNDPSGGYAVPLEIDKQVDSILRNVSPMRRLAKVVQIGSANFRKLIKVGDAASGWVSETASRPETTSPTFAAINPPVGTVYAMPAVTQDLLDDAFFDLGNWLSEELASEFGAKEGTAFITGSGTAQPRGLTTYDTEATADGSRDFGTIEHVATGVSGDWAASEPENSLIDLVYKLRAPYRQNAAWLMNATTLAAVRKFKDSNGAFLWQPALQTGQPSMLCGFPVYEDANMPTIAADSLSIAFGDFSKAYIITDRIGTLILRDPFSNKPYVNFYATRRVGGSLVDSEAVKFLKFSAS